MSNITHGMNIPEVEELARLLDQKANEIQTMMGNIDSKLNATNWVGPDATQFRNTWDSQHKRALTTIINDLQNASRQATKDAQQQQQASS